MFGLKVEKGEPFGAMLELKEGEAVVIGRSHAAQFRLEGADVSRQHVRVTLHGAKVELESLGSSGTAVDGTPVKVGAFQTVQTGQQIRVGQTSVLHFLEVEDEASHTDAGLAAAPLATMAADPPPAAPGSPRPVPSAPPPAAPAGSKTEPPAAAVAAPGATMPPSGDAGPAATAAGGNVYKPFEGTMVQPTFMFTPGELNNLQKDETKKSRFKTSFLVIAAVVLLVALGWGIKAITPTKEVMVDWPEQDGEVLCLTKAVPGTGYEIIYPDVKGVTFKEEKNGILVSFRLQDIPFEMSVSERLDPEGFRKSASQTIAEWQAGWRGKNSDWICDPVQELPYFFGPENGIPMKLLSYTRDGGRVFGLAYFFRHGLRAGALRIEAPADKKRMTENFMYAIFLSVPMDSPDFVRSHWEGSPVLPTASAESLLVQARDVAKHFAPATWPASEPLLFGAIRKAAAENRQDLVTEAVELLKGMRRNQQLWYNRQKLERFEAKVRGDRTDAITITRVTAAVFRNPADQRFYDVRKWQESR